MNNQFKELVRFAGYKNLKEFTKANQIIYSHLIQNSKSNLKDWKDLEQISSALNLSQQTFIKKIAQPEIAPFIQWVGGKKRLLPDLIQLAPKQFNTYYEPFVGGGAMLFKLAPTSAVINDLNFELINTYRQLKDNYAELAQRLQFLQDNDNKANYLKIRNIDRSKLFDKLSLLDRAARFIYLNKAGYNGLYRVNKFGQNNVAYSNPKHLNLTPNCLPNDADYLKTNQIKITYGNYLDSISSAQKGDFVYFDPPYISTKATESYTRYTKEGFNLADQEKLAKEALRLVHLGVKVMLSNSDVPLVDQLYDTKYFTIHHVSILRLISGNASKRKEVGEVIITSNNY